MESFHHCNAATGAHRSESRQDAVGVAPDVLEVLAIELGPWSTIRCFGFTCSTDMMRSKAAVSSSDVGRYLTTAKPTARRAKFEHPPAHGPALVNCVGNPGRPESTGDRHDRQIGIPGVAWIFRNDLALLADIVARWAWRGNGMLLQDPLHRRLADVDTSPGQLVGDLHLPQRGAEQLDLLDGVANEIRESIDRCVGIDEGIVVAGAPLHGGATAPHTYASRTFGDAWLFKGLDAFQNFNRSLGFFGPAVFETLCGVCLPLVTECSV